ncbi:hypothetical protein [Wenzhouxiangella sp. EGI_FJ10409]|uniref:hypothetical protein n=1 Tax=Wenzhouxiangella sp. EGI_FJ10409 TaxID=3243767 RepID=UPI0035DE0389
MGSNGDKRRIWPTAAVLALSVLAHAALMLLPLPGPRQDSPRRDRPTMVVDLAPGPTERAAETPQGLPEPEAERSPPEQMQQPQEPQATEPADAAQSALASSAPAETPAEAVPADATASADRMQAQLLDAARTLGRESEQDAGDNGLQYNETPALPSQPGWLNQYTGTVSTSIDQWKGMDGSRNVRFVTASGQTYCVRIRPPTICETFNPGMSSAVPMIRDCGRASPQAPELDNPWLRQPRAE